MCTLAEGACNYKCKRLDLRAPISRPPDEPGYTCIQFTPLDQTVKPSLIS